MPDVPMPRLSDSMEEGTLVQWLKADGETVARGEEIAEIETDKATMPYEADADGVLRHRVAEGAAVAVGATIATIGEDGAAPVAESTSAAAPAPSPATTAAPAAAAAAQARANGVSVSPVARRAAQRLGVALAGLRGSGPHGRILKADVVAAGNGAGPAAAAVAAATPADAGGAKGATTVVPLSRVQQTIARRMAESKATIPEFTLQVDVDMGAASDLREQLRAAALDPLPSFNDLLVKAAGLALRAHPRANGSYRDGAFELHERVNVGVAVAAPDALLVPTVFDADGRPLTEIARETRALAERARAGTLTPPELAAGTFTVSNLGMLGVDRFAGIVNPPQAAILCAGRIAPRALVGPDGAIAARPALTLTLVSDHRILYGADAAAFLAELRRLLEQPLTLLAA
ncbi:MAG TPA: dihydrolipoamide acetyltransferase family protein [Conexibacter sp.]|nr:dihydrolipoamide acetyltransferase family protein [Conexibacter sp.]